MMDKENNTDFQPTKKKKIKLSKKLECRVKERSKEELAELSKGFIPKNTQKNMK